MEGVQFEPISILFIIIIIFNIIVGKIDEWNAMNRERER